LEKLFSNLANLNFMLAFFFAAGVSAFWWIAGDCLGFRRADAISKSTGRPYKFSTFLRHENINTYQQQTELFCSKGFALWDIVQSCERPGSLDQDITKDQPNDIRAFCRVHPSIRRIVFANGGTGCKFFKKHFKDWLDTGELTPSTNKASQDVLKKWAGKPASSSQQPTIECVVALAVSPAAAKFTYEEKRDFWDEFVYNPGLKDFEKSQTQK
jgi:hypoxanthine-DNA glycosylase